MAHLPRLLTDFDRPPGLIKADYDDFIVDEIPLYDASGAGTHTYFLVEKAGLATMQAVHDLAHALSVRRQDIGYAGIKDARAVTRQWMSIEHLDPQKLRDLEIPRLSVLEITRHTNKLRPGHLAGNAFQIRVRESAPERLDQLRDGPDHARTARRAQLLRRAALWRPRRYLGNRAARSSAATRTKPST